MRRTLQHFTLIVSLFLLVAFIGLPSVTLSQTKFSVICPQKTIGKNDILQIQFRLDNMREVETFSPPNFKGFSIVSGPNQQSGSTYISGQSQNYVSQYFALEFYLKPNSTGKLIIGSARARADGKDFSTAPVAINVTNASTNNTSSNNNQANIFSPFSNGVGENTGRPDYLFDDYILKPGENAAEKTRKNLFVKLEVNKNKCFVGEPITASYKLFTRLRSETSITDAPSFNGFSVSELPTNNTGTIEKLNGKPFNVYVLRKVQLYPMQAGQYTLSPIEASNDVTFIKSAYAQSRSDDSFLSLMQDFSINMAPPEAVVDEKVITKSDPVVIDVKPLPDSNIPQGFKGAVGKFKISSSLEKNNITTDDAGNLIVEISGVGNLNLINAPSIKWPAGVDGYDPKITDQTDKTQVPLSGSKIFVFPFTVNHSGDFTIDSISFSYFDPSTQSYKDLRSLPLQLHVAKGSGKANPLLKKIKPMQEANAFPSKYFTWLAMAFIILFGLLLWNFIARRNKKTSIANNSKSLIDKENIRKDEAFIKNQSPLSKAYDRMIENDVAGFYQALRNSLSDYFCSKLNIPRAELTSKRVLEELDNCNVQVGTTILIQRLLDQIEMNLYSMPSGKNEMETVYDDGMEVIALLDKQCPQIRHK
jgi:hypothetical protein